ncbi:MAG: alkaline phosphatase [Saprospiraceae bacterium]
MMNRIFLLATFLVLSACTPKTADSLSGPRSGKKAKNIILMIGDGMGLTQISAGLYSNNNKLNLEQFTDIGLHKSYSSDNLITDSAAGATAFASGEKTYNGAIGVDPDTNRLITILEEAEARGMATGLIATSTIVHATPASFISHVKSRQMYEEIAAQFLDTEVDYFVGGGKKYFDRRENDDRNILKELEDKGYQVSHFVEKDFNKIQIDPNKNFAYLTSDSDPLMVSQGRDYLEEASTRGVDFLDQRDQEKGFFMMIEGSQIDWGGHANDSDYIISEMIEFDRTIGAILDFAKKDGETLIIVTADHETGGYAINPGSKMGNIIPGFTTDYHTGALIPVFAFGPRSELFSGIYENTAIYHKMKAAFGM